MELNPDGIGFDLRTTARAVEQNPASNVRDIGTPEEVIRAAGLPPVEGGGGQAGGSSAPAAPAAPTGPAKLPSLDWAATFFSSLGLPQDIQSKINDIFTQYSDTTSASAAALAYIRGTPWYDQTYPGIKEAFAKGIVGNEADYRSLLNQQTQLYKQYLGRDITADEYAANLREGVGLSTVGGRLQGAAYASAYGNDWRYLLGNFGDQGIQNDAAAANALGQEKAGLDSPLGLKLQSALERATQRMQGVFNGGALATPALSLASGRLSAPGASVGAASPDVAA